MIEIIRKEEKNTIQSNLMKQGQIAKIVSGVHVSNLSGFYALKSATRLIVLDGRYAGVELNRVYEVEIIEKCELILRIK